MPAALKKCINIYDGIISPPRSSSFQCKSAVVGGKGREGSGMDWTEMTRMPRIDGCAARGGSRCGIQNSLTSRRGESGRARECCASSLVIQDQMSAVRVHHPAQPFSLFLSLSLSLAPHGRKASSRWTHSIAVPPRSGIGNGCLLARASVVSPCERGRKLFRRLRGKPNQPPRRMS